MRPYLTFFFSLLSLTACAIAQLPAAKTEPCEKIAAGMAFDVVSIHLANPDPTNYSYGIGGGGDHLTASNAPLSVLLQFATSLPEDQIVGLTGTPADAHFNIEAKLLPAEDGAPPKYTDRQLQCMVMPMLADRFHLVTHTETRVKPVFELMTAKGGPKLTPAPDSATDGSLNTNFSNTSWVLTAKGETMADFAAALSQARHRPVFDKTGLPGRFTFTLKWTADEEEKPGPGAAPTLTTAMEEQLGLKLQPAKADVPVLVVDHVEMPSEN